MSCATNCILFSLSIGIPEDFQRYHHTPPQGMIGGGVLRDTVWCPFFNIVCMCGINPLLPSVLNIGRLTKI